MVFKASNVVASQLGLMPSLSPFSDDAVTLLLLTCSNLAAVEASNASFRQVLVMGFVGYLTEVFGRFLTLMLN
jgi:hypothetical protein